MCIRDSSGEPLGSSFAAGGGATGAGRPAPTASTRAPASARACTASGLRRDAKTHQVRDAVLPLDLAMCRGRPQERSCVCLDLAFGGLALAWGNINGPILAAIMAALSFHLAAAMAVAGMRFCPA